MNKAWKGIIIAGAIFLVLGVALIIVSMMSGGSLNRIRQNISVKSFTETYAGEKIDSLDLYIGVGKLSILQGDEFRVEAENVATDYLVCEVRGTTLVIEDNWSNSWSLNLSRGLSFGRYEPRIRVYVPAGTKLVSSAVNVAAGECYIDGIMTGRMSVNLSAGMINAVDVRADEFTTELSAGECRIDSLITENVAAEVAAGRLTITGIQTDLCRVSLSAGAVSISGDIAREGSFDCGIGQISLALEDRRLEDYTLAVDVGLGNISVNDSHYSGNRNLHIGSGDLKLSLSCAVGEINLTTR